MDKRAIFEIQITKNAQNRLLNIFETYLIKNFSEERALQVFNGVFVTINQLSTFPKRGQIEVFSEKEVRYILHSESRVFQLKILYHINEQERRVEV